MKQNGWVIGILLVCGCIPLMGSGSLPREEYERTVPLSAVMESGATFSAETFNGSISVHESDGDSVRMTATITALALNVETARKLAETTTVALVPGQGGIETQIEPADTGRHQSVRIDVDAYVPAGSTVDVRSHNGAIQAGDYSGRIRAESHNGNISTRNTTGDADLKTHNGRISCMDISGDITLQSYNGPVRTTYRQDADPVCDISITTYNGRIELVSPPDFSASVRIATHNGGIETDLPISVSGKMGRNQLKGTVGTGEGTLNLETYNGSVEIR